MNKATIKLGDNYIKDGDEFVNMIYDIMGSRANGDGSFENWLIRDSARLQVLKASDECVESGRYDEALQDFIKELGAKFDEASAEGRESMVAEIGNTRYAKAKVVYALDDFENFARANGWTDEQVDAFEEEFANDLYSWKEFADLDEIASASGEKALVDLVWKFENAVEA